MMVLLRFEICGIQNNQVDGRNVTAEDKSFQSLLSNLCTCKLLLFIYFQNCYMLQ